MLGKSLEADVTLEANGSTLHCLQAVPNDQLAELLIVSAVTVVRNEQMPQADDGSLRVEVQRAKGLKCARCWRCVVEASAETAHTDAEQLLCTRCRHVCNGQK